MKDSIVTSAEIKSLKKVLDQITGGVKNVVANCIAAGKLLTQIKGKTKYGDWDSVLESVGLPRNTAWRYMQLWEHRTELDLKEVKTISDAKKIIDSLPGEQTSTCSTQEQPTSKNEPLTRHSKNNASAQMPARRSVFDQDETPRDDSHAYDNTPAPSRNGTPSQKPAKSEKSDVQRDKVGRPIPDNILELWNQAKEVGTKLRSMVSEVKCTLEKGIGKEVIFSELINSVISDAEGLHFSLSQILPYAVCTTCQGRNPDKCQTCRHRGFISQAYWDGPAVGNEMRNIIKKQYGSQTLSA